MAKNVTTANYFTQEDKISRVTKVYRPFYTKQTYNLHSGRKWPTFNPNRKAKTPYPWLTTTLHNTTQYW